MGFDIQPVKGSRRDQVNIVRLGNETGSMTAAIWCPEHDLKTTIHTLNEISEETGQVSARGRRFGKNYVNNCFAERLTTIYYDV